jgi:hypothetical protein
LNEKQLQLLLLLQQLPPLLLLQLLLLLLRRRRRPPALAACQCACRLAFSRLQTGLCCCQCASWQALQQYLLRTWSNVGSEDNRS